MLLKKVFIILFLFFGNRVFASTGPDFLELENILLVEGNTALVQYDETEGMRPSPFLEKIKQRRSKNKKVTAALLAFPFPCGIVGLHRIYLGSAPYVPIVYIATIGGAFGILPF